MGPGFESQRAHQYIRNIPQENESGSWLVRHRLYGQEFLREALGIFFQQLLHAVGFLRLYDEPGVVVLLHAVYHFWSVEAGRIRRGFGGQAEHAAGVGVANLGQLIGLTAHGGNFDPRPLCPQVQAVGLFDQFGNECPADARSHF